jgi:hypothetical protein
LARTLKDITLLFVSAIGVLVLMFVVILVPDRLDEAGYIPHDELTIVYSPDWQIGEYKTCSTLNGNGDKSPEHSARKKNIFCDGGVPSGRPEDGKAFKVRFWGRTYIKSEPLEKYMLWNCRKNGGGDPSITCEQKQ